MRFHVVFLMLLFKRYCKRLKFSMDVHKWFQACLNDKSVTYSAYCRTTSEVLLSLLCNFQNRISVSTKSCNRTVNFSGLFVGNIYNEIILLKMKYDTRGRELKELWGLDCHNTLRTARICWKLSAGSVDVVVRDEKDLCHGVNRLAIT